MNARTFFVTNLAIVVLAFGALNVTSANEAAPLADDPITEKRLIAISEELRCLVCQNESLAGSRADLANDLRREIRGMMQAGQSDAQIIEFLVSRYGDFVLYRPPVKPLTWLLWAGPFLLLLGGLAGLIRFLRLRSVQTPAAPLSEAERRAAQQLLDELNTSNTSSAPNTPHRDTAP
jgi:cytochrome c-type biogenesis protein CcmH